MRKILAVAVFLFFQSLSFAADLSWLNNYQLTELQIGLLTRWSNEEKFTQEQLEKFAASFEKHNLKPKPYVPPHTNQQLLEVSRWAEGGAFAFFAKYAGYTFDSESYNDVCFNNQTFNCREIFNFGYATGTAYFRYDVLDGYMRVFSSLQFMFSLSPETFAEQYLKFAKLRGFDIYLTPITQDTP